MPRIRRAVILGLIAMVATNCSLLPDSVSNHLSNADQDVNKIVESTLQALTVPPAGTALPTSIPPVSAPTQGSVSGRLMYPANQIPALRIVAFAVGSTSYYYSDTKPRQSAYQIDQLPPGTYHVVAYTLAGGGFHAGLAGGYSQMVPCGLKGGCNDLTLIDVAVSAGTSSSGVDPNDFYADSGAFPPNPVP